MKDRAVNESIDNITNDDEVFSIEINKKPFKIDKYTNLAYFGNLLFKNIITLKKAKEQQNNILNIINELEKKTDGKKRGHPFGDDNKKS